MSRREEERRKRTSKIAREGEEERHWEQGRRTGRTTDGHTETLFIESECIYGVCVWKGQSRTLLTKFENLLKTRV
jgi:hypothetical protein